MKYIKTFKFYLCLLFVLNLAWSNTPDIVVMTQLNRTWGQYLLNKISKFLVQNDIYHFEHLEFDQKIELLEVSTSAVVPDKVSTFINRLESYLEESPILNNAPIKMNLDRLEVITDSLIPNFQIFDEYLGSVVKRGIFLSGEIETERLTVKSDRLDIIISPEIVPGKKVDIKVSVLNPTVTIINPCQHPRGNEFDCGTNNNRVGTGKISFETFFKAWPENGKINLDFLSSSFDSIGTFVSQNPHLVEIEKFDVELSEEIGLQIGSYQWSLDMTFLEKFLNENKSLIRDLLIEQMISLLQNGKGHELLTLLEDVDFNDHNVVDAKGVKALMTLSKLDNADDPKLLVLEVENDFCESSKFESFGWDCTNKKRSYPVAESPIDKNYDLSLQKMKEIIDTNEANFVASISEDFINKLMHSLYDDGYFEFLTHEMRGRGKNQKLEQILSLGSKGIQVKFDQKGEMAWAWLDVEYKLTPFQRKILGMKGDILRLPIGVEMSTRIENDPLTDIPNLVLRMESFDYSKKNFKKGIEKYGLESNFKDGNLLRSFIRPIIGSIVKPYLKDEKQREIKIPMEEIKGLGLENLRMSSDGLGRMILKLRLQQDSSEAGYLFAQP